MIDEIVLVDLEGDVATALADLDARRLGSGDEVRQEFSKAQRGALWIATDASDLTPLADVRLERQVDQRLLLFEPASSSRRFFLQTYFRHVLDVEHGVRVLATDELAEVLSAPARERADLFIAGVADEVDRAVILYRGTLDPVTVPLGWFGRRPDGPTPDLRDLQIIDYGQTVRMGQYEASTDSILYEYDPGYRRRAKQRQIDLDDTLGGSVRRLRLARGLGRSDFAPISEKEIARIERNEVKRPHQRSLARIAERLGVSVGELLSY